MSQSEPSPPGSRERRGTQEPSLEELMAGVRLDLTGVEEDVKTSAPSSGDDPTVPVDEGRRSPSHEGKELSVEEVLRRVREELKHRRGGGSATASAAPAISALAGDSLPLWRSTAAPLPVQAAYVLQDLLRFSDEDLVDNAFRILLRRPPSIEDRAHYLRALRSGSVGKVEMLGNIRFSEEGRANSVHVDGLLLPYKMHKWRRVPVLGWFLAMAIAIYRLPRLFAHLQRMEAAAAQESHELGRALNGLAGAVDDHFTLLLERLETLASRLTKREQAGQEVRDAVGMVEANLMQLEGAQAALENRLQRRVSEAVQALRAAADGLQKQLVTQAELLTQVGQSGVAAHHAINAIEGRLASEFAKQANVLAGLERRLRAELSGEVQAFRLTADQLQEQLVVQSSSLTELEQFCASIRQAVEATEARFESAFADQADAQASLERRFRAQLSEEVQAFRLTTDRLQEQFVAQGSLMTKLEESGASILQAVEATGARFDSAFADQSAAQADLNSRLQTSLPLYAKLAGDNADNRRAVRDIERRLMAFFDRASQQMTGVSSSPDTGRTPEGDGLLDAHYVALEDTFRGTREDIKERAEHYLATLADASAGNAGGLVVDLGCGRGEWLEVLTENGYASCGVDLNRVMIEDARALGLGVVESDAVAYLRGLDSDSVFAVTSMHLVEHIPYELLIRMLDEAYRVLQPGGVLILETPNPENLTVGSFWFYMDPTHRNPIPPALLQWVVQGRGFEGAAIDRLTQNREVADIHRLDDDVAGSSEINKIIGLLTAAPDYAIIARKPATSDAPLQES